MTSRKKRRLDELLVIRGLAPNTIRARALVLGGQVFLDGQRMDKSGCLLPTDRQIYLKNASPRYVSRGGLKLEATLTAFRVPVHGKVCLDVGASTGGFTDCLLQHGASKVFALDVGKGQLDWKLRNDSRVSILEETNARYLTPELLSEHPHLVTADVSFISLRLILPRLELFQKLEALVLVKPQFEARRSEMETGGVIRSPSKRQEILNRFKEFVWHSEFDVLAEFPSPILGQKGNQEYFLHLRM